MDHSPLRALADDEVVVGFLDADGARCRRPLTHCVSVRFEDAVPVCAVPTYRGQRSWPGWWWAATTGGHVSYASWRERDQLMMLDFDSDVVGLAARPWEVLYTDHQGRERWHAPALFARRRDDTATVIDTVGSDARGAAAATAAERVCAAMGWRYRQAEPLPAVVAENVRWLAGYRQPRFAVPETSACLHAVFAIARPLMLGAERCGPTTSVLPVLFHLLWHHQLHADLSEPLSEFTLVGSS